MLRPLLRSLLLVVLAPTLAHAIAPGQADDFEDGTPMNWEEGPFSPDPPTNVASGGPAGAGDHYLLNVSNGDAFSPGGKMTMQNLNQWAGDWITAGVASLHMDLANFGASPLYIRVVLQGLSGQYCSTQPFIVPANGQWQSATFGLTAADLTAIAPSPPLATFLTTVTQMRIISAQSAPSFRGDAIVGALGLDNLRANTASAVGDPGPIDATRFLAAPNPFARGTRLHWTQAAPTTVRVAVYDVSGRQVRVLLDGAYRPAGPHDLDWDGRDADGQPVPAGVYFARLAAGTLQVTTRLQVTR